MKEKLIMTPGPTAIPSDVLAKMSNSFMHPSIEHEFLEIYKQTTQRLQQIMHTEEDVLILNGEGILGLEAACASLIEPNDSVLVISNGIFGAGFADFATMYGGKVTLYEVNDREPIDIHALKNFLDHNHDFAVATMVHCETPSGLVNPIDEICSLLKSYGIVTIVDSVSAIGGIEVYADKWQIDILLGGSQKCLSAPSGLTFLSISKAAKEKIQKRNHPIIGFYANLTIWDDWYEKKKFPYTQPVNEINALNEAAKRILEDPDVYERHRREAKKVRTALSQLKLELYPKSGFSDTVTAFIVPDGYDDTTLRQYLLDEEGIMLAGSLGYLQGKVIRIGHMGYHCYADKVDRVIEALSHYLKARINS
jgi:aspartate aminotransferase-like enzyme